MTHFKPGLGDATTRLDRTGSCEYGWRGVVAVYLTGTTLSIDQRNAVIAEVEAAIVRGLAP